MRQISLASIITLAAGLTCSSPAATLLFVSAQGDDGNPGTAEKPFATLARARDELRQRKPANGALIEVAGGDYLLAEPFELTA